MFSAAFSKVPSPYSTIDANPRQLVTIGLLSHTINFWVANIDLISSQSPPSLVAQESLVNEQVQLPLPINHWTIEVEDWHGRVMAYLQHMIVGNVTGPTDPALKRYIVPLTDPESQH